jgi:hypothetical protein
MFETIAARPLLGYKMHKYTSPRGTRVTTKNGKISHVIREHSKFGVHVLQNGTHHIVIPELGHKVLFRLPKEHAEKLMSKAKALPKRKAKITPIKVSRPKPGQFIDHPLVQKVIKEREEKEAAKPKEIVHHWERHPTANSPAKVAGYSKGDTFTLRSMSGNGHAMHEGHIGEVMMTHMHTVVHRPGGGEKGLHVFNVQYHHKGRNHVVQIAAHPHEASSLTHHLASGKVTHHDLQSLHHQSHTKFGADEASLVAELASLLI